MVRLSGGRGGRVGAGGEDPVQPGPGPNLKRPDERVRHVVELRPDICSLDMGSLNMGSRVFINTPAHLETMAVAIRDADVLPELEGFEPGHLLPAKRRLETPHPNGAGMFLICLWIACG